MPHLHPNECLLKRIEEQEQEARQFGFYWENIHQLLEQIQSECREVEEAWQSHNTTHLQEEIGDLLQAAVSLAVFCNLDPYETLLKSVQKFQKRYETVVQLAHKDGYSNLHQQPVEKLLDYWNRAKKT
jgi:uncharacterized protein YabN with tetrapyrrole methylase and pyrophosphatase domain